MIAIEITCCIFSKSKQGLWMWWTRDVRLLFLGEMLFLLVVVVVLELKQLPGPVRLLELYELLSSPVDIRQGSSPSELGI